MVDILQHRYKGWSTKGAALTELGRGPEAVAAYNEVQPWDGAWASGFRPTSYEECQLRSIRRSRLEPRSEPLFSSLRCLCVVRQALRLDSPFNPELTAGLRKAAALGGGGTARDGEATATTPKTAEIQRCRPKAAPIVDCLCPIVPVSHVSGLSLATA